MYPYSKIGTIKIEKFDMQIWLDTINESVIKEAVTIGLVSGITTNPTILSKAKNIQDTLHRLLELQPGPVAVQVSSLEAKSIVDEARSISQFSSRFIVKVPINFQGLIAIKELSQDNIPIVGTAVIHPTQAILVQNVKLQYIAPYFSCMHGGDPLESIKKLMDISKKNRFSSQILVGSLKELNDIIACACLGVDAITIKEELYDKWIKAPSIVEPFLSRFQSDWNNVYGETSIKELLR